METAPAAPGAERGVSGHLGRALSPEQSKQCGLAATMYVIFSSRNTGRTQRRPPPWTTRGWGPGAGAGPSPPLEPAPARDVGVVEGQGGLVG